MFIAFSNTPISKRLQELLVIKIFPANNPMDFQVPPAVALILACEIPYSNH